MGAATRQVSNTAHTMSSETVVPNNVLFVGIAGPTRGGKSTLAQTLQEQYPGSALLHQDRYFKLGGETPDCIDWRRMKKDLRKLLTSAGAEAHASKCARMVIAEGFLLFADAELESWFGVRLFLQLDRDTCYERRLASKKAGLAGDRFDRYFDRNIWPAHEAHGRPLLDGAHILDGSRPSTEVVAKAKSLVQAAIDDLTAGAGLRKPSQAVCSVASEVAQNKSVAEHEVSLVKAASAKASSAKASSAKALSARGSAKASAKDSSQGVLARIHAAQDKASGFKTALKQIREGQKKSHWIWYIWPTLAALRPGTSRPEFLLPDLGAVQAYLRDEILHKRLEEITVVAIEHLQRGVKPKTLFGSATDADKFSECMTVFAAASAAAGDEASLQIFANALDALEHGVLHARAVEVLALRAKNVKELRQVASERTR